MDHYKKASSCFSTACDKYEKFVYFLSLSLSLSLSLFLSKQYTHNKLLITMLMIIHEVLWYYFFQFYEIIYFSHRNILTISQENL